MKFLIAGFGSIGRRHLRNLRALGENDILLYRTHRSTLPEDELAGLTVETDLQAALAHKPDAVIVANPTALHMQVAIPAAEAGCSILMEKPVDSSLERVDELRAALHRGGGQMVVGFQFRFHPGLRQVERLLANGSIGRPLAVRAQWGEYLPNWHPWEDYRKSYSARPDLGGGVVLTLSHPIDYLRWLLGEVNMLSAFVTCTGELELAVDDLAEVNLRFASGATGSLHLNYIQQPPEHKMEIVGSLGTLLWDNADGAVRVYQPFSNTWQEYPVPEGFERNAMFLDEMRHFVAVARGEEQPLCGLEDGVRALQLSHAILRAGREQRTLTV